MNDVNENQTLFIVTEKWQQCDWFNTLKNRKLVESVSVISLANFEDSIIFEPNSPRTLVRRMKRKEAQAFDLPERFHRGAHIIFTRLDEKTVLRSLVFDSVYQRKYEALVEEEMWAYFDGIKKEVADALAVLESW